MIPVIMSGGSGERLWPYSRKNLPKQFGNFLDKSLLEMSIDRFSENSEKPIIVSVGSQENIVKNMPYMSDIVGLYEPMAKNTAPAIGLLCRYLELNNKSEEIVGVFSADHYIKNEKNFHEAIGVASQSADEGFIVTLGIAPDYPATGYGYIELDQNLQMKAHKVNAFREKPSKEKAESYIKEGTYFWNAGIFIFKASVMIKAFKEHLPQLWDSFSLLKEDLSNLNEVYGKLEKISIDYGIMEKADNLYCVPCDIGWMDLGSWDEMAKLQSKESIKLKGCSVNTEEINSKNNFVFSNKNKVHAFIDVEDLIVVDTPDALLISKKGSTQKVKQVVEKLKEKNIIAATEHPAECRPWGKFESLVEEEDFKFKRITVLPGERLSYQSHKKRSEHWILLKGIAEFTLNDDVSNIKAGDHVYIPAESKHRIKNIGEKSLVFVEVQVGTYFGEDDIVRYSDDYGR